MSAREEKAELSSTMWEVGSKLFPCRYQRHQGVRGYEEAVAWAERLDWRNNPYDRYLLQRELLHFLEGTKFEHPCCRVLLSATRAEIAEKIDHLLKLYSESGTTMEVFTYVVVMMPYQFRPKGRQARRSKLAMALAATRPRQASSL
jgi:hypothetical protein